MKKLIQVGVVFIVVLVLGVTIGMYVLQFHKGGLSKSTSDWGNFGGYINGVIGTSFGALSVILIYLTYSNQVKFSTLQQFESTFFNLLQVQREILKSLHTKGWYEYGYVNGEKIDTNLHGADYIEWVSDEIEKQLNEAFINWTSTDRDEIQEKITEVYTSVSKGQEAMLWHYFRHLYHIIKYVDECSIEDNKKQKYIDIISAQMDDNEHYVEFYNCISLDHGWYRLRPLLDEYHFSENLSSRNAIFEQHKIFYPKTEFKSIFQE